MRPVHQPRPRSTAPGNSGPRSGFKTTSPNQRLAKALRRRHRP